MSEPAPKSRPSGPVTESDRREEPGMQGATTEDTRRLSEGGATTQTGAAAGRTTEQVSTGGSQKKLQIEVTPAAIAQIVRLTRKRLAEGKGAPEGLRIGLRGGGCDGFSYVFEWADKPPTVRDHVFVLDTGDADLPTVKVLIDPKSMLYLAGTTLNFITGLMGHGFKFENPNVKGACGCGESVQF
jgi:iron-sulfur cluster assembly protein